MSPVSQLNGGSAYDCEYCNENDQTTPVWEDPDAAMNGDEPDYVGCFRCTEITEL